MTSTFENAQIDGQSVTLEPGGQFELSGAPLDDLEQTDAETRSHLDQVRVCVADGPGCTMYGTAPARQCSQTYQR